MFTDPQARHHLCFRFAGSRSCPKTGTRESAKLAASWFQAVLRLDSGEQSDKLRCFLTT